MSTAPAAQNQAEAHAESSVDAELELREIIARWSAALRARDLDRMMASYENCVVAFEAVPPLQRVGIDDYREAWGARLRELEGPIDHEMRDLAVCAGVHVAFSHALVRMASTRKDGRRAGVWMRWTAGWKKIEGAWLLVHEHVSAPFDMETGAAVLDAQI